MANSKTVLGIIAGVALGAIAGILLAPESGANTRKKIADKAGDLKDSVKDGISGQFDKFKKGAEEGVNTTGDPNIPNMSSGTV